MTPTYLALVNAIGKKQTEVLIARLGGTQITIPRSPKPSSRLALAIGLPDAIALSESLGGQAITLPSINALITHERNQQVQADLDNGLTVMDIARRNGISASQVRRIREATT
jgi:Mor family transcriptional regulator